MAKQTEESLDYLDSIVNIIKTTHINLKKCPKERLTTNYIEARLKIVEQHWRDYKKVYGELLRGTPKDERKEISFFTNEEFLQHEEMYISLVTNLKDWLPSQQSSNTSSTIIPTVSKPVYSEHKSVVLPKIQLPTYSGQYEQWLSFHDLYDSLVHSNESLSKVQKLHYLKTSLNGEAASLLSHIQVVDSNYELAWKLLKDRYGNKRLTVNAIMKRFFSQKRMSAHTSVQIKKILDTTFECLHHLKNLNVETENWDPLIIFIIVQKLDPEGHKYWEEHVSSKLNGPDELPSLEIFRKFLEDRYRTLELIEPATPKSNQIHIREKSFHATTNMEKTKTCPKCKGNHSLSHCKEFGKYTPTQRSEYIQSNNLCFNCLTSGHSVRQCRVPLSCRLCKRRHHTLLHENKESDTPGTTEQIQQPSMTMHASVKKMEEQMESDITMLHVAAKQSTALLATALVQVGGEDNRKVTLRALVDQGSQASFLTERAAQLLKLKRHPVKGTVVGVGSAREDIRHVVQINIASRCEPYNLNVKTYIMSKQLTTRIPSKLVNENNWPHLDGLTLADPTYHKPGSIDLLLGVDVYAQIIQNELVKGPPGSPCAHKTSFGWVLFGKIEERKEPSSISVMHHQVIEEDFLKTLWEIDHDLKRKYTKDEQLCETIYEENYTRDREGRYIVKLPFRYNNPLSPSGNTREIAKKRLDHQERRHQRSPELRKEYDKVLEEYLLMGHMEEVPKEEINNPSVYLPHHAVIRRDKETTKVRVVFDASSKGENGISLNEELLIGPQLQEDLRSIIMRWRMHKICFVGDIVKMYRMILLQKDDTDFQRLLWRRRHELNVESDDSESMAEVKDYRLRTVTFGTAAAPYLAVKTLMKLASDEGADYPEAAQIILEDFFVDDLISGCDTVDQAIHISRDLKTILQRGGFELQKWASNNKDFLKSLDSSQITTKANFDIKLDGTIKALGLSWSLGEDEFGYHLHLEPVSQIITKRTVLSDLQRLFDPLGWIAPAIVTAKILVQKLWLEGVLWDQEINGQLRENWISIREDLHNVNNLKIKRWMGTLSTEKDQITLHGFCDASMKAYAAVVYCRVKTKLKDIKTYLIAARTKVAPVKTISLPRLELSGAALLSKLLHKVSQAMRISSENVFAWTDSTIVVAWISGEPNRWKPYVANRVVDILEHTSTSHWFHVQSAFNPADVASRGSTISELQNDELWWHGPAWLSNEDIEFIRPTTPSTNLERKGELQTYASTAEYEEGCIKIESYNSLTELVRVIALCKRFLNIKRQSDKMIGHITPEELEEALDICIRQVQEKEFYEDIERLKNNNVVRMTSNLKTLNPFLDSKNILRVGGRLRNAAVDENFKHPVILGKGNDLVKLIIADAHMKTMHGGINLMITYLMSKYWIVGCKSLIKRYIYKCLTCARQRVTRQHQLMGDLPESRVTPSRPFSRSGVDFAGPVYVLTSKGRGAKTTKAYICIFICMAVKAIHLELVSDLTSAAFIAAFKRFVARRGRCNELWSDNGKNFVAANKDLHTMWKAAGLDISSDVAEQLANDAKRWHYIPPYSPNHGGLWEAGVKSIKQHLRKVLTSNLTFEEFATVLTQIEACLNSRPLTTINTDVDLLQDIEILTPGHFIIGESLITVPDRDYSNSNVNLLSRWQHTQRLIQTFWKRWQTEYLSRLNQRPKWVKYKPEFEIGDIVLLRDENMPPGKWALARIMSKHPGRDNITRVYSVRYNVKISQRSISGLCPLPICIED